MDNLQFQSKWIMHKILLHFTAIERQLLLAEWFNVEGVYFLLENCIVCMSGDYHSSNNKHLNYFLAVEFASVFIYSLANFEIFTFSDR